MRNIILTIEYDGTNYCGWQIQNGRRSPASGLRSKSIQEAIEKTLQKILQEKIKLIASGRTDAGVHALGQVANFKTNSNISLEKLRRALNGLLPEDICISKAEEKPLEFHSRFDAKSKLYRYAILNRTYPSALMRNTVYFYPFPLDVRLMQQEAKALLGRHNFKSFQGTDTKEREAVRKIKGIKVNKQKDFIRIDIEADGFLYNMARNIAGTLIEIGRGKLPRGAMKRIMSIQNRTFAGPTAPAHGLCLMKVTY